MIRVLLAHGPDLKVTEADGNTAHDFAVKNGYREAVKVLRTDFSLRSK